MDYEFPVIRHIDDVLPHVQEWASINVVEKNGYTVIDYAVDNPEQFSRNYDGWKIRRECRGLIFDNNTGYNLRRPYQKFFNVNQTEETLIQNMKQYFDKDTKYLMKEDGSMISPFIARNSVLWGTRRGETEQAENMIAEIDVSKYEKVVERLSKLELTIMFEYVSPNNRIVLKYSEPQLILHGCRDTITGAYHDIYTPDFDVFDRVKYYSTNDMSADEILESIRLSTGIEGIIGVFVNGHRFKAKGEEYVFIHKSKELVSAEREVWKLILEGNIDDRIPFLDEEDVQKVREIEKELWGLINSYVARIKASLEIAELVYDNDPKRIALEWKDLDNYEKPIIFKAIRGADVLECVVNLFLSNCSQNSKQEQFKEMMKGY